MRPTTAIAAVAAFSAFASLPAHAAVLLTDNFDAENGGVSALNYTGFANFTSEGTGGVDLVKSGDYSITCSGMCVDLDGTPGPGSIVSNAFAFTAGQTLDLLFDIGGSQRNGGTNDYTATLYDAANNVLATLTGTVDATDAFATKTLSYVATTGGLAHFSFSSTSADNVGPLLDNVSFSAGAVPEPATWALMLLGVGAIGAGLRRQQRRKLRYDFA